MTVFTSNWGGPLVSWSALVRGSAAFRRIRRKAESEDVGHEGESEMAIVVRKAAENRTLPSEGPLA